MKKISVVLIFAGLFLASNYFTYRATGILVKEKSTALILKIHIDEEERIVALQIFIKKRTAGFMESIVQLAAYLESDTYI